VIVASDVERRRAEKNTPLLALMRKKIGEHYRRPGLTITVFDEEQLLALLSCPAPDAAAGETEIPASSTATDRHGSGDGGDHASSVRDSVHNSQTHRGTSTNASPSGAPPNVPLERHAPGASNIIKFPLPGTDRRKP